MTISSDIISSLSSHNGAQIQLYSIPNMAPVFQGLCMRPPGDATQRYLRPNSQNINRASIEYTIRQLRQPASTSCIASMSRGTTDTVYTTRHSCDKGMHSDNLGHSTAPCAAASRHPHIPRCSHSAPSIAMRKSVKAPGLNQCDQPDRPRAPGRNPAYRASFLFFVLRQVQRSQMQQWSCFV
jgi:hypothetical protein